MKKSCVSGTDFIADRNNILYDRTVLYRFYIPADRFDISRTDMVFCNIQDEKKFHIK